MSRKVLDHPYRVGRRKRPPINLVYLRLVRKLEAYIERRKALEAIKIGQEAVKHLGFGEDDPI